MTSKFLHPETLLIAVVTLAFAAAHLVTLTRYPVASCDEAHYSNVGAVLLKTGNFGNNLTGDQDSRARNVPSVGRLHTLGVAFMYSLFGVSLFSSRLFSLLGYLTAGISTYLAGQLIFNRTTGAIAASFFLFSWMALLHGHSGRPDIWIAVAGVAVFLLLNLAISRERFMYAGLAGLAAALMLDFHLNGIHFLAAGSFIALIWGVRRRAWKWLFAFGIGATLGLAFWFLGHYVINAVPNDSVWHYPARTAPLLVTEKLLHLLDWWWRQYWVGTQYESLLQGLYFGLGLVALAVRPKVAGRRLVIYIALSALSFGMIVITQADYYRIVWMPLLCLAAAEGIRTIAEKLSDWQRLSLHWKTFVPYLLAAPLLGAYLLGDVYLLYKFRDVNYEGMIAQFGEHIPTGSRVSADTKWWYGLGPRYEFLDDFIFDEGVRGLDASNLNTGMTKILRNWSPDYVIYDDRLGCLTDSNPSTVEFKRVLDKQCVEVAMIDDQWFGENIIYHCPSVAAGH